MSQARDIGGAVEAELRFDPLVDASDITVKNIGGNVALDGTVPSYPQRLEATAAALVPDVSNVKAATAGRTVTLTGDVRTAAEHDAVVGAAWMASGVCAVIDELQVTG